MSQVQNVITVTNIKVRGNLRVQLGTFRFGDTTHGIQGIWSFTCIDNSLVHNSAENGTWLLQNNPTMWLQASRLDGTTKHCHRDKYYRERCSMILYTRNTVWTM